MDHAAETPRPPARIVFGIRAKLLALVATTGVSLVLVAALGITHRVDTARRSADAHALALARQVAITVDDHVAGLDALLLAVGHVVGTTDATRARNDSILERVASQYADTSVTLYVWGPDGHLLGTSMVPAPPWLERFSAANRRYFREAVRSRHLAFGSVVPVPDSSGYHSISVARAVTDDAGRVVAVVSAATRLGDIRRLLKLSVLPPGSLVTLADSDGSVLAHSLDEHQWVGASRFRMPAHLRGAANATGVEELRGVDGVRRLSAYVATTRAPWQVYVGIPTSIALGPIQADLRRSVAGGALLVGIALWLAWIIATRITRPLRALAADAVTLGAGQLGKRTDIQGNDEIGALGRSFNAMADALAASNAALRASETRYRAIFDMSPIAKLVYDPATLRILAVNQAAIRQYGYTREEFLGKTVRDITPEDERAVLSAYMAVAPTGLRSRVWRHVRADGRVIDVQVTSDDTVLDGRPARIVVAEDVSARIAAEHALRASEERVRQAAKMESVGQLAGGIAHDFNNLLTIIGTSVDLARQEIPPDSPALEDLEQVRAATERAAVLTRQLLAFSRRQVLRPRTVSLTEVVRGIEGMLRRLLEPAVTLVTELDSALPPTVADAGALEQVIMNLVLNARDAMPEGGTLTLGTAQETLDTPLVHTHGVVAAGEYVTVVVRDTGTGMDAATLARIFEPFFTTKEVGRGTGLGMAMAHGIVHQSGGTITVRSAPGRGTTVTIYLRRGEWSDALVEIPAAASVRRAAQPLTVLVVEDDPGVRTAATRILERAGHRVVGAETAEDALRLIEHDALGAGPSVVITDLVMSGMGGRALGAELARSHPHLPVLYVSAYTEDELFRRGLITEHIPFLRKPFTAQELLFSVTALVEDPERRTA